MGGGGYMFRKKCDRCQKYSYSSNAFGKWECPYCFKDISHVKEEDPINKVIFSPRFKGEKAKE